jgi:acetyl esterase/lipase
MVWVELAFSLWLVISATLALRPSRKGIFAPLAFPVGWAAGELPTYGIVMQGALLALLKWWGWPSVGWQLGLVLILAAVVIAENFVLIGIQLLSSVIVQRQLKASPWGRLSLRAVGRSLTFTWWRTVLQFPFHPRWVQIVHDVHYGPHERNRLDVWRKTTTARGAPVLLFVHGGSWVFGEKNQQARPMLHEFVARGWIVVPINYRLAPADPWPAQIEDVTSALAWVKRNIASFGGDSDRIIVAGASAGGHLAALLALSHDDPQWRPSDSDEALDWRVRGAISFYGVLEMTGDESVWRGLGHGLRMLLEHRVVQRTFEDHLEVYRQMSPDLRITPTAPPFLVIQGVTDTLVDVGVARHFVSEFRTRAIADCHYVELPFTQHAYDLTVSARTAATTRAALAFAERYATPRPPLSPTLVENYRVPPTRLERLSDGDWEPVRGARGVTSFVITAHNPYSRALSESENEQRHRELGERLRHRGLEIAETRGRALSGEWPDEYGWLISGLTREEACAWARLYQQFAIYEIAGTAINVVDAATRETL